MEGGRSVGVRAARDERRDGRELRRKVSVWQRWPFLCPHACGRICPTKQSYVGLHPIEDRTRKE